MLLDDYLRKSAERHPEKMALVCGEQRLTYAAMDGGANAIAHAFHALGLVRQDRVAVCFDNSIATVQAVFATLRASGVFVVVNPQTKGDKLAFVLTDCNARVLVTGLRQLETMDAELARCPELDHVILADADTGEAAPKAPALLAAGKHLHVLDDLRSAHAQTAPTNPNISLDLASLIYTSGSTGVPKGVTLTHLNMVTATESITTYLRNTPDDIVLSPLPLSFDYGLYQLLMTTCFGGTLVLEKQFAYPYQYIERIQAERVTGLPIVPTILAILLQLKQLENHDFSSVRYVTNTAQALPPHHIRRLRQIMPQTQIYSMYGLTECKRVSYLPPELIDRKPQSVGIAMPNTEVWIEDADGNVVTKPGLDGELIVRGAHVMVGYWNRPDETAKRLRPGRYPYERELMTGDVFRQDEDGHLYFVARKDDVIKTAGERVGPREVENILYELEAVREAAVIGVSDTLLGNAIKAFLSVNDGMSLTEAEVIKHCRRRLEPFMVPKHVAFLPELPRTATGKISKQGLS